MNRNEQTADIRHNWEKQEILDLFAMPFMDLLFTAQTIHRQFFDPHEIQGSQLLSIKTGACPEDCGYCSQSGHHNTGLQKQKLMPLADVLTAAKQAKANGASRFCMGAAWRFPPKKDLAAVCEMIREVNALGLETCATLGMLTEDDTQQLLESGLDYYNHNLDTSPEYYKTVATTRTYEDRLDTLDKVRKSGMKVCCGGIISMGETREDRAGLLQQLANLPAHPKSVPVNMLNPVEGTPLGDSERIDSFEFIRTVAIARIMMPHSFVRLSAGRTHMSEEMQAWCFFAGANSIFLGSVLLTTPNPVENQDAALLKKLGLKLLDLDAYNARQTEATACQTC